MRNKRKKIIGASGRPRLSIYISLKNIYAQIIDDVEGKTLAQASTLDKEIKDNKTINSKTNIASAKLIGGLIAKRALEKNISNVVFDRGLKKYHGKLKAAADEARAEGLKF